MSQSESQIHVLLQSMKNACAAQEFDQMRVLDEQIRAELQRLLAGSVPEQSKVDLLREVGASYQALSLQVVQTRSDIADELMRMKREHKAATAYLNSSLKG